jgi:hypothetical protein
MAEAIDLFDQESDTPQAWGRQSRTDASGKKLTESKPAFEAWRVYARLMEKRSIRKVAQQLDKSTTLIGRWSVVWKWQERARLWDDYVSETENLAFIKERQAMARRQAQASVIQQNCATRALIELDAEVAAGRRKLTPSEITRMLSEGAKLERINRGDPDTDQVAKIIVTISQQEKPRYADLAAGGNPDDIEYDS